MTLLKWHVNGICKPATMHNLLAVCTGRREKKMAFRCILYRSGEKNGCQIVESLFKIGSLVCTRIKWPDTRDISLPFWRNFSMIRHALWQKECIVEWNEFFFKNYIIKFREQKKKNWSKQVWFWFKIMLISENFPLLTMTDFWNINSKVSDTS